MQVHDQPVQAVGRGRARPASSPRCVPGSIRSSAAPGIEPSSLSSRGANPSGRVASTGAAIRRMSSAMRAKIRATPGTWQDFRTMRAPATTLSRSGIVDAAANTLRPQRCGRLFGVLRMVDRHLQEGEGVFHPVVRRQCCVQGRRGLQAGFADRRENLRFHGNSGGSIGRIRPETAHADLILLKAPVRARGTKRPVAHQTIRSIITICHGHFRGSSGFDDTGGPRGQRSRRANRNRMFMVRALRGLPDACGRQIRTGRTGRSRAGPRRASGPVIALRSNPKATGAT